MTQIGYPDFEMRFKPETGMLTTQQHLSKHFTEEYYYRTSRKSKGVPALDQVPRHEEVSCS
jgi:hypothetical protein